MARRFASQRISSRKYDGEMSITSFADFLNHVTAKLNGMRWLYVEDRWFENRSVFAADIEWHPRRYSIQCECDGTKWFAAEIVGDVREQNNFSRNVQGLLEGRTRDADGNLVMPIETTMPIATTWGSGGGAVLEDVREATERMIAEIGLAPRSMNGINGVVEVSVEGFGWLLENGLINDHGFPTEACRLLEGGRLIYRFVVHGDKPNG